VGKEGVEPSWFIQPKDFKSFASASSATRPLVKLAFYCSIAPKILPERRNFLEARTGIAPVYAVLQTAAYLLGHRAFNQYIVPSYKRNFANYIWQCQLW
jgi:hypothetical protein